jgi:probable rRNA maturation factor
MKSDPLITYRRPPATLNRSSLAKFARIAREQVARGKAFHCLITGDAELRSLNLRFRGKNSPTDVLSFPSGESDAALAHRVDAPLGEIALSLARARSQAREYGHSVENEICILMLHGILHLLGMDHETDDGRMARAEVRWRRKLGLPAGLIERVA